MRKTLTLLIILIIPLAGCIQLPTRTNISWNKNLEEENQQLKKEIQRLQMENQILKERIYQLEERDLWWKQQYDALAKWYAEEYSNRCATPPPSTTSPPVTPPGATPGLGSTPEPGQPEQPGLGVEPPVAPLPPNLGPGPEIPEGETKGLEEILLIINGYKASGQLGLALNMVEQALRENPRSELLWVEKIDILQRMGRWEEASEAERQMHSIFGPQ
ncbi:MAG: hypothetical protein DRO11_03895 [Methanobacteriota archaeon]|nr:MAG: hypothetical protein DRO11_03895 [Euryarchaeota archaeon]